MSLGPAGLQQGYQTVKLPEMEVGFNMHRFRKPQILCPACKTGPLPSELSAISMAHCIVCGAAYPVRGGVIDLLPESPGRRTLSQFLLEWKPFIHIYESRLWRKNPLFTALLGISFEREHEVITQTANLKGDEILLDLACGPGIHTRPLARSLTSGSVVGLDLSWPMLNYASLRAQSDGIDNCLLIHGDAARLPFPENEFDAVNCCGAIHLFPDLSRALREITRVLKPGGRFIAFTFRKESGKTAARLARLCRRVTGVDSFRPDKLELHLTHAGLQDVECHHAKDIGLLMSAAKPLKCRQSSISKGEKRKCLNTL